MPIAAIGAIAAIGGGIASSALGAHAAGKAADAQSQAAMQAAQLQHQDSQAALDFQKQVYGNQQQEAAPYLQTGYGGLANLGYLLGITPQSAQAGSLAGPTQFGMPNSTGAIPRPVSPLQIGPPNARSTQGAFAPAPGFLNQGGGIQPGGGSGVSFGQGPRGIINAKGDLGGSGRLGAESLGVPTRGLPGQAPAPGPAGLNTNLSSLINPQLGGFGSLMQGFGENFNAPTNVTEQNDPGFQFRLQQGTDAIQRSAAAKGNLLTGGTAKDLMDYGQNSASNEYGNVYNRALGEYQQRYNIFQQHQADQYNRLASIAGLGQTAVGQLNSAGSNAAGNIGNILLTSGQQQANQLNNAAAARASGYVGGANAWGSTLGNLGNYASLAALLGGFGGGQGPTTGGV